MQQTISLGILTTKTCPPTVTIGWMAEKILLTNIGNITVSPTKHVNIYEVELTPPVHHANFHPLHPTIKPGSPFSKKKVNNEPIQLARYDYAGPGQTFTHFNYFDQPGRFGEYDNQQRGNTADYDDTEAPDAGRVEDEGIDGNCADAINQEDTDRDDHHLTQDYGNEDNDDTEGIYDDGHDDDYYYYDDDYNDDCQDYDYDDGCYDCDDDNDDVVDYDEYDDPYH